MTSEVNSKTGQNDDKLHTCGWFWFGMVFENIQSDPPKEVRGQSRPRRSLQKHVEMTSNFGISLKRDTFLCITAHALFLEYR